MRSNAKRLIALAMPLLLVACGSGAATPSPAPTAPPGLFSPGVIPTAEQLCQLLTPADWTAAGLAGAHAPSVDADEPGSASCTFGGASGGTGGLELDVFAQGSINDANLTYDTIKESIPDPRVPNLAGAQDAVINPSIDPGFGAILVRTGKLVFTITLPSSDNTTNQLISLAALVLGRAAALE